MPMLMTTEMHPKLGCIYDGGNMRQTSVTTDGDDEVWFCQQCSAICALHPIIGAFWLPNRETAIQVGLFKREDIPG